MRAPNTIYVYEIREMRKGIRGSLSESLFRFHITPSKVILPLTYLQVQKYNCKVSAGFMLHLSIANFSSLSQSVQQALPRNYSALDKVLIFTTFYSTTKVITTRSDR